MNGPRISSSMVLFIYVTPFLTAKVDYIRHFHINVEIVSLKSDAGGYNLSVKKQIGFCSIKCN